MATAPPSTQLFAKLEGKQVLLLQGPMGHFFRRLARELRAAGSRVSKINLCFGDQVYFPGAGAHAFRGGFEDWPAFLADFVEREGIDALIVFGDMRPYHRVAIELARRQGLEIFVFEEGYLRPDFLTVERNGVNGNSELSRDPSYYLDAGLSPRPDIEAVGQVFGRSAWLSLFYAMATTIFFFLYPRYEHHREINCWYHSFAWVRGLLRKWSWSWSERGAPERLLREKAGRYFFVPLQVHCDFQLEHSDYTSVPQFMEEIVESFCEHAPPDCSLLLKHHPADRAYRDYAREVERLRERFGLGDRLVYLHDLHLPEVLKHARGTLTINSTVGLSAVHHGSPVMVLGRAVYDLPGLTHQGSLADFWVRPQAVDADLYRAFRGWLEHNTQANGSVWKRLPGRTLGTGVRWCSVPAGPAPARRFVPQGKQSAPRVPAGAAE